MFLLLKKITKTTTKTIVAVLLTALIVYFASFIYVSSFSLRPNIPEQADAVIVLGAKVNLDNTPSAELYYRSIEGVSMLKQNRAKYILFTGGVGLGRTAESIVGSKIAMQNGISKERILTENQSHNTFQNIEEIKPIADKYGIKSVIIVSDQYHVARGVLVAKKMGFEPIYWTYPSMSYLKFKDVAWSYAREAAAMLFYYPRLSSDLY
jgi:uncharacterized SAM-binding protein YcdF (DUF218 family)